MRRICYYISGHGLGHASRSCQVIRTLRSLYPSIAVSVVSDAHPWFFARFLPRSVPVRPLKLDVGVLQQDSLVMREEATLAACRDLLGERERIVEGESGRLRSEGVDLVVADIPSFAFAAAARAGIFSVGLSNFSWDWIYEGLVEKYPGYDDVLIGLRRDYACADLLLRLPFHGEFPAFRKIEDLPLVARCANRDPLEVRRELAVPPGCRLGLISFGGFGLKGYDFSPLESLKDWVFIAEAEHGWGAPGVRTVPADAFFYPDLVRAADVVITKPGYGIVSEAIANDTAVLYTSRGDFREQALLVEGLQRYTRCRFIDNDAFRSGLWGPYLDQLVAAGRPAERPAIDGDRVAAERLASLAGACSGKGAGNA